jgi:hypothetical protein
LQNFTDPGVTAVPGAVAEATVAVRVTTVPAATDVVALPLLVTVSTVVVGVAAAHARGVLSRTIAMRHIVSVAER